MAWPGNNPIDLNWKRRREKTSLSISRRYLFQATFHLVPGRRNSNSLKMPHIVAVWSQGSFNGRLKTAQWRPMIDLSETCSGALSSCNLCCCCWQTIKGYEKWHPVIPAHTTYVVRRTWLMTTLLHTRDFIWWRNLVIRHLNLSSFLTWWLQNATTILRTFSWCTVSKHYEFRRICVSLD